MLVIIMRLQLGKVWNKWASHVPSHSGNVLGLRIFSAEFNAYRKILHWQPWKIKPLFPDSKSMPSRKMISLQFPINRLPDVLWKMGFSVWETQLLCLLLTAEWPSSCLLQTLLGSVRWQLCSLLQGTQMLRIQQKLCTCLCLYFASWVMASSIFPWKTWLYHSCCQHPTRPPLLVALGPTCFLFSVQISWHSPVL